MILGAFIVSESEVILLELYRLKNPVKVRKINKIIVVGDGLGNEHAVNQEHYLTTFSNGYEMCLTKEQFENMFEEDI